MRAVGLVLIMMIFAVNVYCDEVFVDSANIKNIKKTTDANWKAKERKLKGSDLVGDMQKLPPGSEKRNIYTSSNPPFQIAAPDGWFMFSRGANSINTFRAKFYRYDPNGNLPSNVVVNPCINVVFLQNDKGVSIGQFVEQINSSYNKSHARVLLPSEKVNISGQDGYHFTGGFKGEDGLESVSDYYIFFKNNKFITVRTICSLSDYKEVGKAIDQSVKSIKFIGGSD